ncbi:MAG TPA: hypothetical protein VFU29_18685 [Chitinophagaceae bacterium]|nr:hypothetical protein [Chitinophagaceae bacterium]
MRKFQIFLIVFLIIGCSYKSTKSSSSSYNGIPYIEFCDLPKNEGKLIYIKAVYSGIDEYFAINSQKKCTVDLHVEFDCYVDGNPIPKKFENEFNSVHSSYWNKYLIIEATGKYESKNPRGYGHLGSNKSRFILDEIISVKIIEK